MGREGGGEREDGNEYESEVCRCASGLTGWGGGLGELNILFQVGREFSTNLVTKLLQRSVKSAAELRDFLR